jgi:hypothetical protein
MIKERQGYASAEKACFSQGIRTSPSVSMTRNGEVSLTEYILKKNALAFVPLSHPPSEPSPLSVQVPLRRVFHPAALHDNNIVFLHPLTLCLMCRQIIRKLK